MLERMQRAKAHACSESLFNVCLENQSRGSAPFHEGSTLFRAWILCFCLVTVSYSWARSEPVRRLFCRAEDKVADPPGDF